MKIAFIIYDGMTALDFIGVYDPITRLKTMGFISDTGSLLFGAAGLLKGREATTHPSALDELKRFCSSVVDKRLMM